ncbi:SIMPL domain-containing protein [Candidatus Latescibacterota bacterium]
MKGRHKVSGARRRLRGVAAVGATALVMVACEGDTIVRPESSSLDENTIQVSGAATVAVAPDVAQTTIGVQIYGREVVAAVTENNQTTAALVAALDSLGVGEADIQTSNFTIYPQRDYKEGRADSIVGYWVNNSVSVTIRQLDTAGQVLQAAIEAGANSISGLAFTLGDPEPVKDTARALAVADARNRADVLADAAGVQVGKVIALREISMSAPPIYRGGAAQDAGGGEVPVEPGEMEVTAQVAVVFAIK